MAYNQKDIWVGKSFDTYGEFSESEVQVFRDAVKPDHVVLDIGANIGAHTVALARLSQTVFSFEAERHAFNLLCGNVAINNLNNVYCYHQAVGKENGSMCVPELDLEKTTNFGGLSLDSDNSKSVHYVIPMIALDTLNFAQLDFIKVDVEGMESDVLNGVKENIAKFKPIIYAENDREEKEKELFELLDSLEYDVYQHYAPLFNPNNYFGESQNWFINDNNALVISKNVFCHHRSLPCPIDVAKFGMKKV